MAREAERKMNPASSSHGGGAVVIPMRSRKRRTSCSEQTQANLE
jgi:hypothetical protein